MHNGDVDLWSSYLDVWNSGSWKEECLAASTHAVDAKLDIYRALQQPVPLVVAIKVPEQPHRMMIYQTAC